MTCDLNFVCNNSDTPDINKVVLLELEERRSVKYLLGSSMEEVMSPTSPSKSPGKSHGSRLTEAVKGDFCNCKQLLN